MDCGANRVHGVALLRYSGSNSFLDVFSTKNVFTTNYSEFVNKPGRQLNALNRGQGNADLISVADLRDARETGSLPKNPDRQIFLGFSFSDLANPNYAGRGEKKLRTPQINNISLILPPYPLLTQQEDIDKNMFCSEDNLDRDKHCPTGLCQCYHMYEVDLNDVVEIFLVDEGLPWDVSHPMHLHGHQFHVLAMERLGNNTEHLYGQSPPGNNITVRMIRDLNNQGKIPRNLNSPAQKDTVVVPDAGYTLIRFVADNPGFWLLHCHMSWHSQLGMAVIVKVGTEDTFPTPPQQFPTCRDFL